MSDLKTMSRDDANRLLDFVRAGGDVPQSSVLFALWLTGDLDAERAA